MKGGIERLIYEYGDIFIEFIFLLFFRINYNYKIVLKEDLIR